MKNFVYIIGSMDDFETIEDLKNTYFNGADTPRNMSFFSVILSETCKVQGYDTLEDIATMIGRGEAMSNDWCLDGTFSCILEA